MELITILNRCHHFRGFVYQHARFSPDKKSIEVSMNKALDEVRAHETRRMKREGLDPVLRRSRWLLL